MILWLVCKGVSRRFSLFVLVCLLSFVRISFCKGVFVFVVLRKVWVVLVCLIIKCVSGFMVVKMLVGKDFVGGVGFNGIGIRYRVLGIKECLYFGDVVCCIV